MGCVGVCQWGGFWRPVGGPRMIWQAAVLRMILMGAGESSAAYAVSKFTSLHVHAVLCVLSCCRSCSGRRSRLRVEPLAPPICLPTQV